MRPIVTKLIIFFLFAVPFLAGAFSVAEKPAGFLNDYAKVLSAEESQILESKLEAYENNTTNEVAVVIISSLDGDTIENLAQEIFTKWGIGKKDKNNGVLFLISIGDRKTRIHTGYGVEGDLTDIGTSYIQSDVVAPAFREGNYYAGINGALDKMMEALGGSAIVPENYSEKESSGFPWDTIFILGIVFLQFIASILARSKSWWGGEYWAGWRASLSGIFL